MLSLRFHVLSLPHGRGHPSQDVQLMRDVQECTLLDLGVALRYPGAQTLCVQLGCPVSAMSMVWMISCRK